ncbi:MAG TPA: hypothetical protein VJ023_22200, partial [Pyrinomonadaceae bacterium]|nr:hypothetical protein [Pyrinomonadaceae bacterium]
MNNIPRYSASFARIVFAISFLVSAFCYANAQSYSSSATDGFTPTGLTVGSPAGSYPLSGFESVNPYNGGLNFNLPVLKIGGRGTAGYMIHIPVEQRWRIVYNRYEDPATNQFWEFYTPEFNWWAGLQPRYGPGVLLGRSSGFGRSYCPSQDTWNFDSSLTRLTFTTSDGTEYELRDQATGGQPATVPSCAWQGTSRGTTFVTADGTAATFISDTEIRDNPWDSELIYPSGYLMLRDGTKYRIDQGNVTWIRDRNGNKITISNGVLSYASSVTDSLNRQVTFGYANTTTPYDEIAFKGFQGATRRIKVSHTDLGNALRSGFMVQTCAALFPGINASNGPCESEVISEINLPDERSYKLRYNSYGELARVELPTGGVIEYDWAAGLTGGPESGLISTEAVYRRVVERRVYNKAGVLQNKTTFSRPEAVVSQTIGYVDVSQYDGNNQLLRTERHHYFGNGAAQSMVNPSPVDYPSWNEAKEYRTETFDANGILLRSDDQTWQQGVPVSTWNSQIANNPRLSDVTTRIEPSSSNLVSKKSFAYDDSVPYNNQSDVYEYGFGPGTPGALERRTHTAYVTGTTYAGAIGAHLRNLPTQTSVYDATGVERARTTVEYDNYATDSSHAALKDWPTVTGIPMSGHDLSFGTGYSTRGNATATTQYLISNGAVTGSITAYAQYDTGGSVVKTVDARGYATTLDYRDNFGVPGGGLQTGGVPANTVPPELSGLASYAFPFAVSNALSHTAYAQFDYYLGRPVDGEDANGIVASGYYNDPLDRPTQIRRAVGTAAASQTAFAYDDTNRVVTSSSDLNANNDNLLTGKTFYDGLGRTTETRQHEGGTNYIAVQTQYDSLGRAFKTSNPFRPWQSEVAIWTTTGFDALGRVTSVTTPDSAVVTTSYSGNTVTVTDQTGKKRKSVTDALGRLKEVYEDPTGVNYLTSYSYDALDNLTTVNQGTQTRTFVYDSLKRLTSATNPESGTITYTYDNNGNLLTKTDARPVTSTYTYDALNRNTSVDYSNTTIGSPNVPDITRFYDGATNGKGRFWYSYAAGNLSTGANVEHSAIDSYDALGRPSVQRQLLKLNSAWGPTYQISRGYNLAGAVTSQTYPSGRTVSYAYDNAGRANTFTGNLGDGTQRTYSTG